MTTKEQQQASTNRSYCAMSPTAAHRWIIEGPRQTMRGECKYCHAERTFSPFEGSMAFNIWKDQSGRKQGRPDFAAEN